MIFWTPWNWGIIRQKWFQYFMTIFIMFDIIVKYWIQKSDDKHLQCDTISLSFIHTLMNFNEASTCINEIRKKLKRLNKYLNLIFGCKLNREGKNDASKRYYIIEWIGLTFLYHRCLLNVSKNWSIEMYIVHSSTKILKSTHTVG